MAEFAPDVDALLQRFVITKPNEEFQVEPVAPDPDPTSAPSPLNKQDFTVPSPPPLQQLQDEAAKVQEIIGILKDTAPQISVPVSPEEQPFLGTTVTTRDYLTSLESRDDLSLRKQQQFEAGVLSQYGDTQNWPLLLMRDLVDTRNSLLAARDFANGTVISAPLMGTISSGGTAAWQDSVLNSDLSQVHDQLIQSSAKLRFKTAQTVFTLNSSLQGSVIEKLLGSAITPEIEQLKPSLRTLVGFLQQVRALLTHSQFLLASEHVNLRDGLLNATESLLLSKLLNILSVKLSGVVSQFVKPVLDALDTGLGSGPIVNLLGSSVDQQLVSVIGGTCQALVTEYKQQVAGFIRDQQRKSDLQLNKLQALGERSLVGRWMAHLDQIINVLQKVLTTPSLTQDLASKALNEALKPLPSSTLPVLQRFLNHPELQQAQTLPLQARTFGSTLPVGGPPVVGITGTQPQFGSGDINPYPQS